MAVLQDVVFAYTKIQQAVLKYQSTTEKEYTVDCVVSKAQAKEWNKKFKKQPAKVYDNEDFTSIFKIDPPFAEQDEQYVIKLKRDAQYADGNPIDDRARPKVYQPKTNGKLVDITADKLVGNGSIGSVSYTETENDYGTFARLKAIRVDDLVEYEATTNNELGEVEEGDEDVKEELAPSKPRKPVKQEASAKPAAKAPVKQEEEPEEEAPVAKPVVKRGRPAKAAKAPDPSDDDSGSPF